MDANTAAPIEITTGATPQASIIMLHGLGADGHDLASLAEQIELPIPVRFIFPHAPEMPVTLNGGMVMPSWYDITHPKLALGEDEAGIRASLV